VGRVPDRAIVNPRAVGVVVLAVITAAVVWFFGVDVPLSLAVGGVVAAVGLTWTAIRDGPSQAWPVPPVRSSPGARRDLSETAWALGSRGGAPERMIRRARAVARHRLRTSHRLDLDDSADRTAVEAVLPRDVVAVLCSGRPSELSLARFEALLRAVAAVAPPTERTTTERQP